MTTEEKKTRKKGGGERITKKIMRKNDLKNLSDPKHELRNEENLM